MIDWILHNFITSLIREELDIDGAVYLLNKWKEEGFQTIIWPVK